MVDDTLGDKIDDSPAVDVCVEDDAAPTEVGVFSPPFMCASISALSSSVIIVVATEVMSFIMEISPI